MEKFSYFLSNLQVPKWNELDISKFTLDIYPISRKTNLIAFSFTVFSPYVSTTVKEFSKLVELLIVSAQCIIWNRKLPHFSPLHTDSFNLSSL